MAYLRKKKKVANLNAPDNIVLAFLSTFGYHWWMSLWLAAAMAASWALLNLSVRS